MQHGNLDRQKAALDGASATIRRMKTSGAMPTTSRRNWPDQSERWQQRRNHQVPDATTDNCNTKDLNASLHAEDMAQKSIKDHYLVKPEKGGNKNYEQEWDSGSKNCKRRKTH